MKSIIIYTSVSHGNTAKVAKAMAQMLKADLVETSKASPVKLKNYDLVGFGSGIYNGNLDRSIFDFVDQIPRPFGKKSFVFSTSGDGSNSLNEKLEVELAAKGSDVLGSFACKGWDTYRVFKLFGGIARNRPNDTDLNAARNFVKTLQI